MDVPFKGRPLDSLTQIVLGASVAGLSVPAVQRRAGMLAGAVLGTVPDLDALVLLAFGNDPVTELTWHRGPSHSLPMLLLAGWLLWRVLRRRSIRVAQAPGRWLLAICLALLTHPLLDAFTVYGTQLLWPWPMAPVMWSSIFIIDPLYTAPLLLGCLLAWRASPPLRFPSGPAPALPLPTGEVPAPVRNRPLPAPGRTARNALALGLLFSSSYLGWSVAAKSMVDEVARQSLVSINLQDAPSLSTPTPFNTLLWRVVARAPNGYWVGYRSLLADQGRIRFQFYPTDYRVLDTLSASEGVQRLLWFSHGFVELRAVHAAPGEQRLIMADVRMGLEPRYFFRYDVAGREGEQPWQPAAQISRIDTQWRAAPSLSWVWCRLQNPMVGPPPP